VNIRDRLRFLILATLLPIGIFGAAGTIILVQKERRTLERDVTDSARGLMHAVETEMQSSIGALDILARSPALDRGDLRAFRAEARRTLESRNGAWANVVLAQPDGTAMMNLLIPEGRPVPESPNPGASAESARLRQPTIGQVAPGAVLKRPLFAVRVPVIRDGEVVYVVSSIVEISSIERLMDRQDFPRSWAVAVLDGNYRFVVRYPRVEGSEFASDSLKKTLEQAHVGWQRGRLLDGSEIYRAVRRSAMSAWSVSIAVPKHIVDESLYGLWLLLAGFVAAGALGLWIAWHLATRISRPIAALAAAAPAVGRGEMAAIPQAGPVEEVRQLSHALGEAASAIRTREEQQRQAELALRAADRAKDEFLAMLGHELRNPLASVANAAQLLKLARNDQEVLAKVSELLSRQVDHMTRLVDDLLEVGRVTGGKVKLERVPLDLARAVGDLVETWRSAGRFRHHDVSTDLHAVWASADPARVEQVAGNLIENALKYTPSGGRILIAVHPVDGRAVLEVTDTGEGMAPELIGRVFDLFVQGDRSLARQPGGLGIGLTMTRRLVELHGGTIEAKSEGQGRGAKFTVSLPAIERPAPHEVGVVTSAPAGTPSRRILLVEDNRDALESLAALLTLNGHQVRIASSGAQGLAMAAKLALDVAIIDIGLPDIDGYEMAAKLRHSASTRALRLIALTGYGTPEDRRRALNAGFDAHLAKPADVADLEKAMQDEGAGGRGWLRTSV